MKSSKTGSKLSKMFIGLAVILATYSWFFAGYDAGKHYYASMVPNLILAIFWSIFLGILLYEKFADMRMDCNLEMLERLNRILKPIAEGAANEKKLSDRVVAIIDDVTKGVKRPPNAGEQKTIIQRFKDETGHDVRLEVHADKKGMDVHISKKPAGTKIPVKGKSRTQKVPVRKKK